MIATKATYNPDTKTIDYMDLKTVIGSPVKKVDAKRIGGYLNVYTTEDDPDLTGEWFSKETDFMTEFGWSMKGKPILMHHALDDTFKAMAIGVFDFEKEDDIGSYVEGILFDVEDYEKMLKERRANGKADLSNEDIRRKAVIAYKTVQAVLATGKMHWSSGALPQSVRVNEENGHIDVWPRFEGSTTPTPAEPDGTEVLIKSVVPNFEYSLKSAFQELEALLIPNNQRIQTTEPIAAKEVNREPRELDVSVDVEKQSETHNKDNLMTESIKMEMDEEQLRTMMADVVRMTVEEMNKQADEPLEDEEMDMVEKAALADAEKDAEKEDGVDVEKAIETAAQRAVQLFAEKQKAKAELRSKAEKAAQDAAKKYARNQPAGHGLGAATGMNPESGANKSTPITVDELRAYSELTAEEMALGVKLALNRVPEWQRKGLKLQDFADNEVLSESYLKTMAHKAATSIETWKPKEDNASRNDYMAVKSIPFLKADELHATDITGQGAEWVELLYDTQLWRRVREDTELFNRMVSKGMRVKDIPTGVKGMNVKLETASGTVYTLNEANSVDATGNPETVAALSQITTSEVEQDLATHIIAQGFTFQMQERSIIDVVSYLNEDMQRELTEAIEDVFINGDTATAANTNINLIDGTPAVGTQTPLYIAFDGIRKNALSASTYYVDNADAALAAIDYERVRAIWPLRFRRKKQNILLLIDEQVETQTRRLAEAFTVGVAGETNATFFTGDLSLLVGYDVYASAFLNLSNGNGKISATAGNNTQGQIYGIFCPYWQYGRQLNIRIEEARYPLAQSSVFVATVNHLLKERSGYASVGLFDISA